jgi:hypothetical protein
MEQERKNLDLSALSFHEVVAFFFDRKVVPDEKQVEHFRTDLGGEKYDDFEPSSPERLVDHLTNLMLEFGTIARVYAPAQVDQGIWGMWSGQQLQKFLWDRSIPLECRIRCIGETIHVYTDFVAKREKDPNEDDDGGISMWWDLIVQDFWARLSCNMLPIAVLTDPLTYNKVELMFREDPSTIDSESRVLLNAMFETLTAILAIPNRSGQESALHGLGHLYHPGVYDTVQRFIDSNPTGFELAWLEQCRDCCVL